MRTITKALVAAAAVAGTMTASAALATAEPAATPQTDLTTQDFRTYTGYGTGSFEWAAIQNARWNAETWAHLDGFDTFLDCWVFSQSVTQISDFHYSATVNLWCQN